MEKSNPKYTLADKVPLHKELKVASCCETCNYRSIVGMILYLAGSTRTDIKYAVHQYARFSHDPRCSHELELKHIARYLKHIRMKVLVM